MELKEGSGSWERVSSGLGRGRGHCLLCRGGENTASPPGLPPIRYQLPVTKTSLLHRPERETHSRSAVTRTSKLSALLLAPGMGQDTGTILGLFLQKFPR